MTIVGTRPEIIRLSRIIPHLDQVADHLLVHTGQNFDPHLSDLFFQELGIRQPNHHMHIRAETAGAQIGAIIQQSEQVLREHQPDRLLLLGDTNSALSAIMAQRMGIPVYHMEAGNRCYDRRVPEEVNRRIIDHSSDLLLPYTERSRANLLREGNAGERIFVTGNPIYEVLQHYAPQVCDSSILDNLALAAHQYILVTMHRAENVDIESRLRNLVNSLIQLQEQYQLPVIISTHPRTKASLAKFGIQVTNEAIHFLEPFGLFDFVKLEQNAFCVLTDSGTVQEECCIFGVPTVTIRDVTERPETLEVGSNILSGADVDSIIQSVRTVVTMRDVWESPREYLAKNVSQTVIKILLSHDHWHRTSRAS
jgi:UDP-N-acetylglucosamine 2-epimerase (non-hydrolysing)